MRIALGADHRGHNAIRLLADKLRRDGHDVQILGGDSPQPSDYPDKAWLVGKALAAGQADLGILICGTGIGMSIAANKIPGIRAAVVHDELTAQLARSHNNANVICMSADLLGQRLIEKIIDVALRTTFEGGRHARRVNKIALIESGQDPTTAPAD
jgi:ribose 5-phosphate isomerase B